MNLVSRIREIFVCGFLNPGLLYPEYSSRIRNRTKSDLESRIQVPLTNAGIEYLQSGIRGVDSRIQDCLGFPYSGVINLIKKKRQTIAIKEHKIWRPNKKGIICERNWAECSGKAKMIMRKCIFGCVNKTLLLVHPRNCPLVPVDDFPVSCGSYVYLLVISQSLEAILWYISFTLHCLVFALYFLVYPLFNKTALLSANPQIQEFFSCLLLWWKISYIQKIP